MFMESLMDLKSKAGPITAVTVLGAAVVWMAVGGNGITQAQAQNASSSASAPAVEQKVSDETLLKKKVQAQVIRAQIMADSITLSGTTQPSKEIQLTSGAAGKVRNILFEKGDYVKEGKAILSIDTRALKADIANAKALIAQRQLELDGAVKLKKQKYSSAVNVATSKADLTSAKAALRTLEIDLENTRLIAPFSGILNTLDVEVGQLVQSNAAIGNFVSINPLTIEINVPQNKISRIQQGLNANVQLSTGDIVEGTVSYVSSVADNDTRSIAIEIKVPNQDNKIPAGITAHVDLALPQRMAHAFSAALLTLDDDGKTAVKTLNIDNEVVVSPVEIIKSDRDQVWVSGLPQNINIITVGQGFTKAGEIVDAYYKNQ